MSAHRDAKAYLVGGGIASLAAAVFLIRDGGFRGENIHIMEALPVAGGSLDASGDVDLGYVTRGGRMLEEEAYACLWDLLDGIPALSDAAMSVKDEIWEFNRQWPTDARARLIGRDHTVVDASDLGLTWRDRLEMLRLLATPERMLGAGRITDLFSAHFLSTNFWCLWRTTFAFQDWHSAVELRRYFYRFIQEFPRIHTLAGVRRTPLNQYDSIVRPIQYWLRQHGVVLDSAVEVTDVDFASEGSARRVSRIHYTTEGADGVHALGEDDYAFITIGSMVADSAAAGADAAPELVTDKRDSSWRLWEHLATKADDFGNPTVFAGDVDQSKWESFTLTMRDPLLIKRIEEYSGNTPGSGALMTFKNSSWLLSIVVPHQPHFSEQPADVYTLWGYGLLIDRPGDYVPKPMSAATGDEILTELVHHLGFEDAIDEIRASTTIISVMLPYITSQFAPRTAGDRPLVVPRGSTNFAFLGQFVEMPDAVVFTVEYSIRAALQAVSTLLQLDRPLPPIYRGIAHPRIAFDALRTALR
jgi:oleate hydratase